MIIDQLNNSGNGNLYFLYLNEYKDEQDIGYYLDFSTNPSVINISFKTVRIYRGVQMFRYLDEISKSVGFKGFLNYFNFHNAFVDCTIELDILERSKDKTTMLCKNNQNRAMLEIKDDEILLSNRIRPGYMEYFLFHGIDHYVDTKDSAFY